MMADKFIHKDKVLIIVASPRKGGNSEIIANICAETLNSYNINSETINLTSLNFSSCVGCESCRKNNRCNTFKDDMTPIYNEIISSKGLILISPVYNCNITAWMKAFIDRLYCFYDFELPRPGKWSSKLANQNRLAIIASVCEQFDEEDINYVIRSMAKPIQDLGYNVIKSIKVLGAFEKGSILNNKKALSCIKEAGKELANKIFNNKKG